MKFDKCAACHHYLPMAPGYAFCQNCSNKCSRCGGTGRVKEMGLLGNMSITTVCTACDAKSSAGPLDPVVQLGSNVTIRSGSNQATITEGGNIVTVTAEDDDAPPMRSIVACFGGCGLFILCVAVAFAVVWKTVTGAW